MLDINNLPDEIEVTFTQEDVDKAGPYQDNLDCLMATALKRMGLHSSIGADGEAFIYAHSYEERRQQAQGGSVANALAHYHPIAATPFDAGWYEMNEVKPWQSCVGRTVVLKKEVAE